MTAFFAAARDVDQRLRAAAQRVNAEIGTPAQFSPATLAAISAASPERATALLPGGMPRELQQPVLAVVNDLVSRFWAFRGVGLSAGEAPEGYLVRCLAHGAQPAARFAADLQTAETAAESSAAFPVAQPDSRAAAEIAVYVGVVVGTNSGCMSCGGGAFTPLPPIVWHRDATAPGGPTDGTVGGVAFRASYQPVGGWRISFLAC